MQRRSSAPAHVQRRIPTPAPAHSAATQLCSCPLTIFSHPPLTTAARYILNHTPVTQQLILTLLPPHSFYLTLDYISIYRPIYMSKQFPQF